MMPEMSSLFVHLRELVKVILRKNLCFLIIIVEYYVVVLITERYFI